MGVAVPVVGAVMGVASAVQQNNAAKQQANAQRASLDQQAIVEKNNTALRLIELQRQKLYSDMNFQIQSASREISKFSDANALQLATQQDLMNKQQQEYATQSNVIQQKQQSLGLDQGAAQSEFGGDMQAKGILSAEAEQARQVMTNNANEGAALNAQTLDQGRQAATAFAQFAGMGGAGMSLSDRANMMNLTEVSQSQMAESLNRYQSLVDQVSQGKMNAAEVARLTQEYGRNEAAYMRQSGANSRNFLDLYQTAQMQDISSNSLQTQEALKAARGAMESDYTIQEANQKLNQSYYDIQNKSQASTVQSSSAATQAALATQRGAIQNPGSFGVLSSLVNGGMAISNVFGSMPKAQQQQNIGSYNGNGLTGSTPYSSFAGGSISSYKF